jgi:hypothetical protein
MAACMLAAALTGSKLSEINEISLTQIVHSLTHLDHFEENQFFFTAKPQEICFFRLW